MQITNGLKYKIAFLLFSILLCQNLLHSIKDALPMTLGNGYYAMPLLRTVSMIMTTILLPICYFLLNRFSFYTLFINFFLFSSLFLIVMNFYVFPYKLNTEPIKIENEFWALLHYWDISAFFLFADIWPFLAYGLLFWNMLNTSFNNKQAKEYYNFFLSWGNAGMILAGILNIVYIHNHHSSTIFYLQTLSIFLIFIFLISSLIVFNIKDMLRNMTRDHMKKKEPKHNLGVIESIKFIFSNSYIMLMFFISMSYSMIQVLAEPNWQFEKDQYSHSMFQDFVYLNSIITVIMGFCAVTLNKFGKKIFTKLQWLGTSLLAPILICISVSLFLIFKYIRDTFYLTDIYYFNLFVLLLGILQFLIIKSIRFSIWDFSFEMLYIPLNSEKQSKGKAAISLISAKYGKVFSSLIIYNFTSIFTLLPIILILTSLWILSIIKISKMYDNLIRREDEDLKNLH